MPLDPHAQAFVDQVAAAGRPPLSEVSLDEARAGLRFFAQLSGPEVPVARTEDRTVPGRAGLVPVRVYWPPVPLSSPPPMLVWFHGGGFVIGDLGTADSAVRGLAAGVGCVVVSVDYRLAPEHPWPAGLEDCWAATEWCAAHGGELGADPTRLAVGGDSAGGNLAALVALRARDRSGPQLRMQLLVYPGVDMTASHPSIHQNGEGYFLTADAIRWFRDQYLPDGVDPRDAGVSPLYAPLDAALAPAFVVTAEYDPLRDEGEAYALLLKRAGVAVEARRYDGQIHAFFGMPGLFPMAEVAMADAVTALRRAL